MAHTSAPTRLGLWRVTRHERVRALYDRLAELGLLLAQLDRFDRRTDAVAETTSEPPDGVHLRVEGVADGVPSRLEGAPIAPADRLVVATRDGSRVGHCVLSNRPIYVPELRRRLRFEGSYLWRLYVRPRARGQGIGTGIIGRALSAARTVRGTDRLVALVAPDNVSSRRAFADLGFRPTERLTAVGCGPWTLHRRRPLSAAAD
jgi:RimJ/RimL family protein N-acetyltransferase